MATKVLRFDMRAPAFSPATPGELYATALEMAQWADERDFDLVSLSEHHGTEDGFLPSPLVLAGCMVGRTRKIQVGISALLLPLYDPVKLAEDLSIPDLASGGRVGITAGIGYRRQVDLFAEYRAHVPRHHAVLRMCRAPISVKSG